MRPRLLVPVLVVSALLVGTCGFVIGARVLPEMDGEAGPTKRSPSATRSNTSVDGQPWTQRPSVRLSYEVAPDHRSASGVEHVTFTPDKKVCGSLVFRAWPNKPEIADYGGSLRVTGASVEGDDVTPEVERRGAPAGAPGTLVRLPLRDCVRAGDDVSAKLTFEVTMARGSGDRVDRNGTGEMWFASAYPVLAWERGHGWMTDPAVDVYGEMDGAEEFRLALDVVAPTGDEVLGTGTKLDSENGPRRDTTRHRFTADSVRNVAVSVGGYDVTTETVDGVRVHVGVSDDGSKSSARQWHAKIEQEIGRLQRYFGAFPYKDLWVTVVPDTSGIEFPGAIFYGDYAPKAVDGGDLVGHELAHMYFYALVGNDQGRDPWLDESFATYAQALADRQQVLYADQDGISEYAKNKVGKPMTYWDGHPDDYSAGVYGQGAVMLFEARRRAGAREWDAAIRAYIQKNAHRIVRPEDFVAAVDDLPGAVDTLRKYGAVS